MVVEHYWGITLWPVLALVAFVVVALVIHAIRRTLTWRRAGFYLALTVLSSMGIAMFIDVFAIGNTVDWQLLELYDKGPHSGEIPAWIAVVFLGLLGPFLTMLAPAGIISDLRRNTRSLDD